MTSQRPRLTPPPAPGTRFLDGLTIVGVVAAAAIALHAWTTLPEIVPVHFGLDGRPNGWGSKGILWLFPALALLLSVQFTWMRRIPHTFNYPVPITPENALRQYQIACTLLTWMRTEMVGLMALIPWQIEFMARGGPPMPILWVLPILALFVTVGWFLYQAYQAR